MCNFKRKIALLLTLILSLSLLSGCSVLLTRQDAEVDTENHFVDEVDLGEIDIENETVALSAGPAALPGMLLPEASGVKVKESTKAKIDYSNIADGYVMAKFTAKSQKQLKAKVVKTKDATCEYFYNLNQGEWATFPLSDGNGEYQVKVLEATEGGKFAAVASVKFDVKLKDEFGPFLRPNQYVNYEPAENTVKEAERVTKGIDDPLKKVEAIYNFVVSEFSYDYDKAATVQSGYLPVLDDVLAAKKGICFDYAAVMAGMLRSQGVPCKLVVGYAGTAYHAWISVYTEESGWIDGAIFFDGTTWHRMDPTFASTGGGEDWIMEYIGDGSNYVSQKFY